MTPKFSKEKPPVWDKLVEKFGVTWDSGVIVAYGDTVYSKFDITPDLVAHETVHLKQQEKIGAEEWWKQYLTDPVFRLEQEKEAYIMQMFFAASFIHDRNSLERYKHKLATDMATMYGDMCTYSQAKEILK